MGVSQVNDLKKRMDEIFTLHWNEYQPNLNSTFRKLRNETRYKDVTLVTDDQKLVSAHKIILSMCSGYFQNVLSNYSHEHPMMCLDGISSNELNNILDYIYNGEMQVHHENIQRYLQLARKLQLQGLIELGQEGVLARNDIDPMINNTNGNRNSGNLIRHQGFVEFSQEKEVSFRNGYGTANSKNSMKTENDNGFQLAKPSESSNILIEFQAGMPLNEQIDQIVTEIPGTHQWQCDVCHKVSNIRRTITEHAELHFAGLSFQCPNPGCDRVFKTRNNLRVHHKYRCNNRPEKYQSLNSFEKKVGDNFEKV